MMKKDNDDNDFHAVYSTVYTASAFLYFHILYILKAITRIWEHGLYFRETRQEEHTD